MKKKFLQSFMLICINVFAFGILTVSAKTTGTYGYLTYEIKDGKVKITDCSQNATNVVIPNEIEETPVTCIGSFAFFGCTSLTNIVIGEGVTTIGDYAFSRCSGLTSLAIPENVSSIGSEAFYGCTGLTNIVIGESVTTIGDYAFKNCTGLTSLTIPENVTSIGDYAFYDCTALTKITWNAKNVADFTSESDVFNNAGTSGNGIEVVFSDSVERIPAYMFYVSKDSYKPKVATVSIAENVTTIGSYAFYDCTALTKITWNAKNVADFTNDSNVFYNAGTSGNGIEVVFGDSVESIPAYMFYVSNNSYKPKVATVSIGENITKIDGYAFSGCTGLTSLTIPENVTSIGSEAFYDCTGLTNVVIGEDVTTIGSYAFEGCTALTKITWNAKNVADFTSKSDVFYNAGTSRNGIKVVFSDSVESVPAYMFYVSNYLYKPKVATVSIGENVTTIGSYAFYDCTALTKITWNAKNVADFTSESNVFYNAGKSGNGIEVVFSDSVESIPAYMFYVYKNSYHPKVATVSIGENVTTIGDYAFRECFSLTNVMIGEGVTTIGDDAFYYCDDLTNVVIGEGVTTIGDDAFQHCTALTKITWNAKNVADFTSNSDVFYNAGTSGNGIEVVFGNSVESIPAYMFYVSNDSYKPKVATVSIGENVTSIGSYAFSSCSGLTSLTIPENVTSIGYYAFRGCRNITELTIPFVIKQNLNLTFGSDIKNNLTKLTLTNETSIPMYAFKDYEKLSDITLNNGITSIGTGAFNNCGYANDETNWDGECLYLGNYLIGVKPTVVAVAVKDGTTVMIDEIFKNCTDLLKVTLPESMINIPNYAFYGCTDLFSITLPGKINAIGNCAFYNCSCLTSLTIPENVTSIGSYAFSRCSGLTSLTIPENVSSIGDSTFSGCSGLTSLTIPENVTSIGSSAFSGCTGLTNIVIGEGVTTIGNYAFYNCDNLQSVNIPASVTNIGTAAFYYCKNLEKVNITDLSAWCKLDFSDLVNNPLRYGANLYLNNTLVKELSIPSDITAINKNQFYGCKSITAVKIHSNVEKIEENAFYGCENIEYVEIPKDLFYIRNNAFYGCNSLAEVHYGGTESDWEEIIIADGNDSLKNAKMHSIYYIKLIDGDGNTSSITCLPNAKINISDIEKKYMHKVKIYTDSKMTKEFNTSTAITGNMTLYVKLSEKVTVIYGDIDDDGEITMNDAIYLFNAAMFPDQYPISAGQKTDYNADGKFDMNDAIYLFNHAMFPEHYPI